MSAPAFLYVQGGRVDADAVAAAGGEVLATGSADEVDLLEPGTPAASVLLARWPSREALDAGWEGGLRDEVADGLVLAAEGLPPEGLPDRPEVPTTASVQPPELATPPAYMVIQGSVTDAERIGAYRDLILPMMKERDSLYVVFATGEGEVRVLRGEWDEQIYAISRWPTHASAHDFWYSERYQEQAIPLRTGSGRFHVHLLRGRAG